ncbi:tRNA uridine-5-carboxymethylaminomethyl(34) synthesis enzyme MnmG, partial [bacterium]|nr:tRNA uridine-5-carboxymethylaminomethyl(34) synthesis enzyme MnmG [bacterium]
MNKSYDVIVIGGGHAGCEAALAAARMGMSTLLLTLNLDRIAHPPCNPSMGGVGKSHLIAELDALGGEMAANTDKSSIQWRYLNTSKGYAVRALRVQIDKFDYCQKMLKTLVNCKNLCVRQGLVTEIVTDSTGAVGVKTINGYTTSGKKIIITGGTFLGGKIHIGNFTYDAGRSGELPSVQLSECLTGLGLKLKRLKTGTPPRVDGRTIDFDKIERQESLPEFCGFSTYEIKDRINGKMDCFITRTNVDTRKIILDNMERSALFSGNIKGVGPRYCPSIEDKIVTFAEKEKHQLFLEPEGFTTNEYYINGFSSSLPWDIQLKALRKISGLENVKIYRPGYAIEYDYYPPTHLRHTLETKKIKHLYFAGQINGTTGYEEAAAQGLIAGVNASLNTSEKPKFILNRDQAYIGVLIDDLVTKGVDEPYRMFTSRAEYRILLRQDNADLRLTELSYKIGLANEDRFELLKEKIKSRDEIIKFIKAYSITPDEINS